MNFSASGSNAQSVPTDDASTPQTVAEKSEFKSTSQSAEVARFVEQCAEMADHVTDFVYGQTVEGRDLVGAIVATSPYELGDQDRRNVVLLLGNIHSGECAGKEALLILLRELTHDPEHQWLKDNVILIAPNYNADGNDRMGKRNRPGQLGPENGMGRRENAQQLDLNRDFCKIESPEARALVALINNANPHLFVDCHTTNGSKHQYALTYDIPHNPTTAAPIRDYLRQKMMPAVTDQLAKKNTQTFYYGNFNPDHTQWTTYGHEPRYSTEYVGLRGRLAVLSEAYSYISYRDRIFATKDFVSSLLDYMTEHRKTVHEILDAVDSDLIAAAKNEPARVQISLDATVSSFDEKFTLKGFKDDQPHDYQCEFVGKYVAGNTTPLPFAYVIPEKFSRIADRLKMHGVQIERLSEDLEAELEVDTITDLNRQETAFQKHKMVRAQSKRASETRKVESGSFVIRTAQPLGRFISYMLESNSDDGFVFWNFFDEVLKSGAEYPVLRIEKPIEIPTVPVTKIEPNQKIDLGMIDGPNSLLNGGSKTPKWFGKTNWLTTKIYNREMLIDAESAAFVDRPSRLYNTETLTKCFISAGLDEDAAKELAADDPLVSTNSKYAIFDNGKHAFLLFLGVDGADAAESKKSQPDLMELGATENQAELFDFNDDESILAFVTKDGLNFLDLKSRKSNRIEAVDEMNLVGKLDWVYQEELYGRGNFKAFWWNQDSRHVAFLSLDESPVIPFTVMDHLPVRGKSEITNYPKAGDPLPKIKLGVATLMADSPEIAEQIWVDLSKYADTEFLISRVTWSADGERLMIQLQNREQTWLDLIVTDRNGNDPRVLFRDQTEAWIESPGEPVFISPTEFLWISPRSGYRHIYNYKLSGDLVGQLTQGDWEVRELLGTDKRFCYFTAAKENAIDLQGYRLNLESKEIQQITNGSGAHGLEFSHDFSLFLDSVSTVQGMSRTFLCRSDGEVRRRLNVSSDDRMNYLEFGKTEFMEVKSSDGFPLDAMLIRPPDFDPAKKYPVLVYIYAGPQAPSVRNRFGGANYLWHQMLAQQGYVVWMCDNRSASYRSAKDVWPIHKNMATHELSDIEAGVDWLKQQPWVDSERIGIWGWSYGGYMTLYAMTNSQSFKMGISGAPVTDWKNYDAIYTERYMGLPQNNPEGYASSSVLNKADQLRGNLLLVHGTIDDNVHVNNSIQFIKELQDAGKQFDLMMYPGNRHSVRDKKQAAHLRKLMTDFVLENL